MHEGTQAPPLHVSLALQQAVPQTLELSQQAVLPTLVCPAVQQDEPQTLALAQQAEAMQVWVPSQGPAPPHLHWLLPLQVSAFSALQSVAVQHSSQVPVQLAGWAASQQAEVPDPSSAAVQL